MYCDTARKLLILRTTSQLTYHTPIYQITLPDPHSPSSLKATVVAAYNKTYRTAIHKGVFNMKNTKFLGIAALVAVIVFSLTACETPVDSPKIKTLSGTITISPTSAEVGQELTANYTGKETVAYQWKRNGSNVGTNATTYTPNEEGSYTVTVSASGYKDKTSAPVPVADNRPALSGDISISPDTDVSTGTELTATYTGDEAVAYQWRRSGSNVGTNATTYTPEQEGSYTVTVSADGYKPKTSAAVEVSEADTELTGITAVYDSTNPIFPDTTWDTLKGGLTVTAHYSDRADETLDADDYELSGDLAEGESVITVTYHGKKDTFTVTVHAPHEHQWSRLSVDHDATCTAQGQETWRCSASPTHDEIRHVDALGHDWKGDWTVTTDPTCTAKGVETETCNRDASHKNTRDVTALGHDEGAWHTTTPATCEAIGTKELRCTRDNAVLETGSIDALGHDWNDQKEEIVAVSETKNGVKAITCKNDKSHTKEEEVTEWATGTAGLAYELISGGDNDGTYRVRAGTVTSGAVHIPAYHRPDANSDYKLVTEIGSTSDIFTGAFNNLSGITAVTFAEESKLTIIGNSAFNGCRLSTITIPASVTAIGTQAFSSSPLTGTITIPASVTSIGDMAFFHCTNLTSITVDVQNPNYASENGIVYNKAKTSILIIPLGVSGHVTVPEGITDIGTAFAEHSLLTSITLPEGITTIESQAFSVCRNLANITIPASVTSIASDAFYLCGSFTGITVADGNSAYASYNGILYNATKTEVVFVPIRISGNITLPDSVTAIGDSAFNNCEYITGVTLSNTQLVSIGDRTFAYCKNLASITLPASLTSIGRQAFYNCSGLETVTFEENSQLQTIGYSAFAYCNYLTSITLPASLTSIGSEAFYLCGITSITIPTSVTVIEGDAFRFWTASQTINVPFANAAAKPAGWNNSWNSNCNAIIKYWNGSSYE